MKVVYCVLFVCNMFVMDSNKEVEKIEGFDMNRYLEVIEENEYYVENISEYFELIQE